MEYLFFCHSAMFGSIRAVIRETLETFQLCLQWKAFNYYYYNVYWIDFLKRRRDTKHGHRVWVLVYLACRQDNMHQLDENYTVLSVGIPVKSAGCLAFLIENGPCQAENWLVVTVFGPEFNFTMKQRVIRLFGLQGSLLMWVQSCPFPSLTISVVRYWHKLTSL